MIIPQIDIEQIRPELTWKLRQQVLYPDSVAISPQPMPGDDMGIHFGAFYENKLVGVVSLFSKSADFQFRKFAVDTVVQRKGIGNQLLQYITDYAIAEGGMRLWCNARVTAIGFYQDAGFNTIGEQFSRNGFDYIIMEKKLFPTLPEREN